jgi:hypothetical protein
MAGITVFSGPIQRTHSRTRANLFLKGSGSLLCNSVQQLTQFGVFMVKLDCMQAMIAGYIASPKGQEALRNYIASAEGQKTLNSCLATTEGKQMAKLLLKQTIDSLDLPEDVRDQVRTALEKKK